MARDGVFQFPDISRPAVFQEEILRLRTKRRDGPAKISGGSGEKPIPQNRNIFFPLAQRRQSQTNSADSVIKVFAKLAGFDFRFQFA